MSSTKYFRFPFGVSGDLSTVPDVPPGDGTVNYQTGYPLGYQLPDTDPDHLDIERNKMNQLFNDMTTALQQYQQLGAPNYIEAAQNGGIAFSYERYAIVRYDDGINGPRVFMSKTNSNNTFPTDASKWWWLDNTSGANIIDNAQFDVGVLNRDAVYWDSVSATFKKAIANGSTPQNVVGFADVTYKRVYLSGYVDFLTGLTPGKTYYLSDTTPGGITETRPNLNIVEIGYSKSSTEMFLNINDLTNAFVNSSISTNGYMVFPNGFIMQWGVAVLPATGISTSAISVSFPINFSNNVFSVVASFHNPPNSATFGSAAISTRSITNSGFDMNGDTGQQGGTPGAIFANTVETSWIALGN